MTWFKLDDGWLDHPKMRLAGKDGRSLWVAGGTYCSKHLTDGRIEKASLTLIAAQADVRPAVARVLVEHGLWIDHGDYYEMHDFLEFNPTREKVEAERDRWKAKKRRQRESPVVSPGDTQGDSTEESDGESRPPRPDPSRPTVTYDLPPPHDLPREQRVAEAVAALVEADLTAAISNGANIRNPEKYRSSITQRITRERGPEAHKLAHDNPAWTGAEIAQFMDNPATVTVGSAASAVLASVTKDRSCPGGCFGTSKIADGDEITECPVCSPFADGAEILAFRAVRQTGAQ